MKERKLILYIACSLDGYIAKPGDDLEFLDRIRQEGEDYGFNEFLAKVDTVIVGRRTHDWVLDQVGAFPHQDKKVYVITRTPRESRDHVTFYHGDIGDLIHTVRQAPGKHIFCDGGAEIVQELLKRQLLDEMIINIIPVLTGEGIRLFREGRPEQDCRLINARSYPSGLLQMHYSMVKNSES
jgi:dihydrofolate reductase